MRKISICFFCLLFLNLAFSLEIDLKGKNIYLENKGCSFHGICFETVNSEEKLIVNGHSSNEVCVKFNPNLRFVLLNISSDSENDDLDFYIKVLEETISHVPGFEGSYISSSYLNDFDNRGYRMKLNLSNMENDTVITYPNFSYKSKKTSIDSYISNLYMNI